MTVLHAQPYDISAVGFYFKSVEEYNKLSAENKNEDGYIIEEYELQFIDGEAIDAELFNALYVNQANYGFFLDACEEWYEDQKTKVIIAVGEVGYEFDLEKDAPDKFDMDLYEMDTMKELAYHYVEEGLFGEVPDHLAPYLDYDIIARDLEVDYSRIVVAGKRLIYRCD